MITEINAFTEYMDFIEEMAEDPCYSDPHYTFDKENLFKALGRDDEVVYVCESGDVTTGLFVWNLVPEDRNMELLIAFSREKEAYREMMEYMENKYKGFKADFVFNPKNDAIRGFLEERGAKFDPEQVWLTWKKEVPATYSCQIEEYTEKWKDAYMEMHNDEGRFWTAEKVLNAPETFRVLLAIKDEKLIGYMDVTHCHEDNEPFDIFVKEEFAEEDYEAALMQKALELNKPKKMSYLVDVDDTRSIDICKSLGFEVMEGRNSMYAWFQTKK